MPATAASSRPARGTAGQSWWERLVRPDGRGAADDDWSDLDFDDDAFRRGEADGLFTRFARNGVRTFFGAIGGSGTSDICRFAGNIEINVNNFVLPTLHRKVNESSETTIMLRASLCCDAIYKVEGSPPMVFDKPELTLICLPKGMRLTIEGSGGVRHQGINGIFSPRSFAEAYRLGVADLPPVVRAAVEGRPAAGRIISLPLDHRVANLVADTIDTTLEGEMRALQYAGRLSELVAYAFDAVRDEPSDRVKGKGVLRWRDADLAQLAVERLARSYREPPRFDQLARELGTNANKLQTAFKGAFGMTMAQYCLERRMREAQQLLLEGKLSVAEVAERVGYAHQSNFAAAFSSHVGSSPRDYRRHRAPISLELQLG